MAPSSLFLLCVFASAICASAFGASVVNASRSPQRLFEPQWLDSATPAFVAAHTTCGFEDGCSAPGTCDCGCPKGCGGPGYCGVPCCPDSCHAKDDAQAPPSVQPNASHVDAPTLQDCDARSLIARHEGKRDCVYIDTMGHPTIGIGYNLDNSGARSAIAAVGADYDSIRSGKTCLTNSQVMKLFEPSYQSAVAGAKRAVSSFGSLCCGVQTVMTDMDYNLGDGGFGSFHGFISFINQGKWADAAADGRGTAWCRQVGSRCSEDMGAVAQGCGGPSPSPPSPSPPSPSPSPSGGCCLI